MLIAEDLVLVGTTPDGRSLLGSYRKLGIAGALLTELALGEHLAVDERGRLRLVARRSTGDPLLDLALGAFAEREGRKPKDVLERVGNRLQQPVLDSLARRELLRPVPVKVLGVQLSTKWMVVPGGPREAALVALGRVVTGASPDARTGALVSLLHAMDALPKVVEPQLRPGMSTRDVKRRGKEVTDGRWASEAVVKAVQDAMGALAAAAAVGGAAAASS